MAAVSRDNSSLFRAPQLASRRPVQGDREAPRCTHGESLFRVLRSSAVVISALSYTVGALLLIGFILLEGLRTRGGRIERWSLHIFAAMTLLAALTWFDFFRFHSLGRGPVHYTEFFHYWLGPEYFSELGYQDLYDAVVAADYEDDPQGYAPEGIVRSLQTYAIIHRSTALVRADEVRSAFAPQRWAAFKRDVATFRETFPSVWRSGRVMLDHGYNGAPLTTVIFQAVIRLSGLSGHQLLNTLCWIDPVLILLTAAWIGRRWGPRVGLSFVFFWALNPLNDYPYIGGAFLRTLWFVLLALGLLYWRQGASRLAGVFLAVATHLTVFPAFFAAVVLLRDLISPDRWQRVLANKRFYLSFGGMLLILVAVTSFLPNPSGKGTWRLFLENTALHRAHHSPNVLGLAVPFMYSPRHNMDVIRASQISGEYLDWVEQTRATMDRRRPALVIAQLLALAAVVLAFRRARHAVAPLFAIPVLFIVQFLAHYYYAMLSCIPLLLHGRRAAQATALTFLIIGGVQRIPPIARVTDFRFTVLSCLLGLCLATAVGCAFRREATSQAVTDGGASG